MRADSHAGRTSHTFISVTLSLRRALCVTALALAPGLVSAQPTGIELSGLAFIDYAYIVSDEDPDLEGANSFDYRRIYLTADSRLSDDVRVRVRLEAIGQATTAAGRPSPFVKDVWVRWQYAESGHRATLGVQPPPLFDFTESVWGYRSLDRTVMDRSRIRSSRDFGVRLDGPLALGGDLQYHAMVGNGRGVRPEAEGEEGKHVYGQVTLRRGALRASLGADYTARIPNLPDAERQSGARVSGLVGAVTDRVRGGVEVFYNHAESDRAGLDSRDGIGVSVFGAVDTSARTSVIARYDYLDPDVAFSGSQITDTDEHYLLAAVAYRPLPALALMPNVIATFPDGEDPSVVARVTADVRF